MSEKDLTDSMEFEVTQKLRSDYIKIKNMFPGNGYMDRMSRNAYTSGTVVNVTEFIVKKYGKSYDYYIADVQLIASRLLKEIFK